MTDRWSRSAAGLCCLLLLITACATRERSVVTDDAPSDASLNGPPLVPSRGKYSAEIRRTSYGVPHVTAKDEVGIGYGVGYSYAQDNFCQLAEAFITAQGERSKHFGGENGGGPDRLSGAIRTTNLKSDVYFKWLNSQVLVDAAWNEQRPEVQALVQGYAAGFNRYLAQNGRANLPTACRHAAWVRDISPLDVMRLTRRYAVQASSLNFIDALFAAQPPNARQAAVGPTASWPIETYSNGSNAVALGKDATANGRGLLLGNPHYPWHGILRFYQFHITIPGKLDVMGASLPGMPLINIGFTKDFAWSHTVNTSEHMTVYELTLDATDPTKYRIGDQWRNLTKQTVDVEVLGKDGATTSHQQDIWQSHYGPVIVLPGLEWSATKAYVLRDANIANNRMMAAWYGMNVAGSLDEFAAAVKTTLGIPWVNTIAADKEGRALYMDVTVVPNLSAEKLAACVPAGVKGKALHGTVVLDGSNPACGWEFSPDLPQPGIVPADKLPVLWRTDYVQNSNDSAWMTNPAAPLAGYSPLISVDDEPQGGRTRMGVSQIQARLAGTDGLPGNKFDMKSLQQIAFNNRSYFGSLLREDLLAICKDAADLKAPCDIFRNWDGTAHLNSVGYPLFEGWRKAIEHLPPATNIWAVPFSAEDPINTPRGLRRDDPAVRKAVRDALAGAVKQLQAAGVDWTKPWGELQYVKYNTERIGVHGGSPSDIYNVMSMMPARPGEEPVIVHGSSYIQTVAFTSEGPVAEGFLTYSQSTDPASPHYIDQLKRFSERNWISQPFTSAQIEADPNLSRISISE